MSVNQCGTSFRFSSSSLGSFPDFNQRSANSSPMNPMSLARPMWEISWKKDEIIVDKCSFKLVEDPLQCRKAFVDFLEQLKIPPVFNFQLDDRWFRPDDSYDENPVRPMPFDILPLLEYHKKLVRQGENPRESEVLINWLIHYYLPNESIIFAKYNSQKEKMGTEVLEMKTLMNLYGFELKIAACYEAYRPFPIEFGVYVPFEPRELNEESNWICLNNLKHGRKMHLRPPSSIPQFKLEIQNITHTMSESIEQWLDSQDQRFLDELASYVTIAESELLPSCPPELESPLRHQIIIAKEILFAQQALDTEPMQMEEQRSLSPESARRPRSEKKLNKFRS